MLMGVHKTQRMALALTFYSNTTKMVMNFSITKYELTGDETWVSFVNAETKRTLSVTLTRFLFSSRHLCVLEMGSLFNERIQHFGESTWLSRAADPFFFSKLTQPFSSKLGHMRANLVIRNVSEIGCSLTDLCCTVTEKKKSSRLDDIRLHSKLCSVNKYSLGQCFSTARPRASTRPWHQLYRALIL
jgi:hypothetical protein